MRWRVRARSAVADKALAGLFPPSDIHLSAAPRKVGPAAFERR